MTPANSPSGLADSVLLHELENLHVARNDVFRHGSEDALAEHTARTLVLEREYLRRWPEREVDPRRTREGARDT